MTFETDLAAAEASGLPFRRVFRADTGTKMIEYLTQAEIDANTAAQVVEDAARAQRLLDESDLNKFDKRLKAVAIWTAQKLGIPLATARSEIKTIMESLL